MKAICLIDTSIFVEILDVPGKAADHSHVLLELEGKIENQETLFLPIATILETGNHIAQNGDGRQRRTCAKRFVTEVKKALEGHPLFNPVSFLEKDKLQELLSEFPDYAMRKNSLGDLSIIQDFEKLCRQNPSREVYVWSQDSHLSSFHQQSRY